ncbi:MAG: hypothetical protein ACLQVM_29940 [Terriglobia bacterium]
MRTGRSSFFLLAAICALLSTVGLPLLHLAKEKNPPVRADDLTLRLFQLLDTSYAGKLSEFYVLADVYTDPKTPDKELQHILKAEYDKERVFGRFRLYVRNLDKLTATQLKDYNLKQIYEFGAEDVEKFTKTDPGSFGRAGDLYSHSSANRPLLTAPITDEARKEYETYITQWILPALEKK